MWPVIYKNPKNLKENKSNYLAKWLDIINFNKKDLPFKYPNFIVNGKSLEEILNYYYNLEITKYEKEQSNIAKLDIWQAKDSKDISKKLYYYIVMLSEYMISNFELYEYYKELIENLIKEQNLEIDFNTIVNDLILAINEQLQIYKLKYNEYITKKNEILSNLYKYLYGYTIDLNNKMIKERQK